MKGGNCGRLRSSHSPLAAVSAAFRGQKTLRRACVFTAAAADVLVLPHRRAIIVHYRPVTPGDMTRLYVPRRGDIAAAETSCSCLPSPTSQGRTAVSVTLRPPTTTTITTAGLIYDRGPPCQLIFTPFLTRVTPTDPIKSPKELLALLR